MGNIFGGVEPPQWLQQQANVNREHGQWGQLAGTLLGGLVNGLQRDPNAPATDEDGGGWLSSRKGFTQGLTEARMNQQDPMWRLKANQQQAVTLGTIAKAEELNQNLELTKREEAGWMADLPKLNSFVENLKTDPNAPMPSLESMRGMKQGEWLSTAAQRNYINSERMKIAAQNGRIAVDNAKRLSDFNLAVSRDPVIRTRLATLPGGGYQLDQDGKPIAPSLDGLSVLNDALTNQGANPEKAFGYKPTAIDTEAARQNNRVINQEQKQKDWMTRITSIPRGSFGKLLADRDLAEQSGADEATLKSFDDRIAKETHIAGKDDVAPEVITANGKSFLRLGKTLRSLDGDNTKQKLGASMIVDRIKKLQDELIKNGGDSVEDAIAKREVKRDPKRPTLTQQLIAARVEWNDYWTKATPVKPADAEKIIVTPLDPGATTNATPAWRQSGSTNSATKFLGTYDPATGQFK